MKKSPINLILVRKQLEEYLHFLILLEKRLSLRSKKHVPGSLHLSGSGDKQYYYRRFLQTLNPGSGKKWREEYLSTQKDQDLIRTLAQQDYENKLLKEIRKQLKAMESILGKLPSCQLDEFYSSLPSARKKLVLPAVPDRQLEIQKWQEMKYTPGYIPDNYPTYKTNRGETVRSKSEKIIADKYDQYGIPYHYEQPLTLMNQGVKEVIHPDYTVLNKRTMELYYHEHFGIMDDPGYVRKNLKRLDLYQENGIFVGDKLLITYEFSGMQFNDEQFMRLIRKYLL